RQRGCHRACGSPFVGFCPAVFGQKASVAASIWSPNSGRSTFALVTRTATRGRLPRVIGVRLYSAWLFRPSDAAFTQNHTVGIAPVALGAKKHNRPTGPCIR